LVELSNESLNLGKIYANKMIKSFMIFGLVILMNSHVKSQKLRISEDKRHIIQQGGKPFFWLGDTAWELFHRLTREEADFYLENRAEKGFNVIQAVVLAELDGLQTPNVYGETPFNGIDPAKINKAYFEHVDYIVNKANELGMFVAMLPTWGDKFNRMRGIGPVVFNAKNSFEYGKFLGDRYKNNRIIWVLGGDRIPTGEGHMQIIRSMASGIRGEVGKTQIFTYHPMGGRNSAMWFHNDDWLDLNMFQSGHGKADYQNFIITTHIYNLPTTKPVLDGEPCYEDHPIGWKSENGWFDDFDSRRAGWWSMLAGACGHTYGNHNLWQMWQEGREPVSEARTPWKLALDQPGAAQAGFMRSFFETLEWQKLVPNSEIVKNEPDEEGKVILASVANDGSFLVTYTPFGDEISMDLSILNSDSLIVSWYNPRENISISSGKIAKGVLVHFDPPGDRMRGNDWVLLVKSSD